MTANDDAQIQAPVDRRRRARIDSIVRTMVRAPGSDAAPIPARTVDLCENGARVLLRRRIPVNVTVHVDLECELPRRVHLGFDMDSLVIDGPMHRHIVRLNARTVRCDRRADRLYDLGLEFDRSMEAANDLQVVRTYIDHLREYESWYTA